MKRLSAIPLNGKYFSECRIPPSYNPLIKHICTDSRTCTANSLFFAIEGLHVDGHDYISEAIQRGAVAVVHSKELTYYDSALAYFRTDRIRTMLSFLSAEFYDNPQKQLTCIGVTGTDGKTSTCEFIWQLMNLLHVRCGLIDTVHMDDGSKCIPSPYRQSTPEPTELYPFLSRCRKNGLAYVVIEATSHGLSDECARLKDIEFSAAVFTTVSSEHLEFHKTLARYIDAKFNLARQLVKNGHIVSARDFPYLESLKSIAPKHARFATYALDSSSDCDLAAVTLAHDLYSRTCRINTQDHVEIPFGPAFFTRNMLGAALAVSQLLSIQVDKVCSLFNQLKPIEGRFALQRFQLPFSIIIDFAHTPDAFEHLFSETRSVLNKGRMIALFGAAGERDVSKRKPMGTVASRYCAALFLTDEDPRKENSAVIINDIIQGIPEESQTEVYVIFDRRMAIAKALRYCKAGDILLLLGKGHEHTIQYANQTVAWNESNVLEEEVERLLLEKDQ